MGCNASRVPGHISLYYHPLSAPCRSVMLTATALGIKLDFKMMDLMKGEHLTPDFIKINPQHCIPTLDDEGYILWESRAICTYLCNMYATDDSLYPRDPKKRALIDSRLDFDQSTLYLRFYQHFSGLFRGQPGTEETLKGLKDALTLFDTLLINHKWSAGDHITIADLCLVATVSTIEATGLDLSEWARVNKWLLLCKKDIFGYKESNQNGVETFKQMYNQLLEKTTQKPEEHTKVHKIEEHVEAQVNNTVHHEDHQEPKKVEEHIEPKKVETHPESKIDTVLDTIESKIDEHAEAKVSEEPEQTKLERVLEVAQHADEEDKTPK